MDSLDLKLLKQLAKVCRASGISSYKGHGFEFTLSEVYEPQTRTKRSEGPIKSNKVDSGANPESDELSPEAMLMWSVGANPPGTEDEESGSTQ